MDPSTISTWLGNLFTAGATVSGLGGMDIFQSPSDAVVTAATTASVPDSPSSSGPSATTWVEIGAFLLFLFLIVALLHEAKGL